MLSQYNLSAIIPELQNILQNVEHSYKRKHLTDFKLKMYLAEGKLPTNLVFRSTSDTESLLNTGSK